MNLSKLHIPLPAEEYHARPEWSYSQVKLLPTDPESFYGYHIAKLWEFKQTDDMYLGECLHAIHLEGKEIIEIPPDVLTKDGKRAGNVWKAYKYEHELKGDLILPAKEIPRISAMSKSMSADPEIAKIFEAEGFVEHNLFWTHEATGLACRARLDKVGFFPQGSLIADIKSTNIDPTNAVIVGNKIASMQYHRQAANYFDAAKLAGYNPKGFIFIFVRNKPPYNARAWMLSDRDIDLGRKQNDFALRDLKHRIETNDWLGAGFGIINRCSLPPWAYDNDTMDVTKWSEFTQFEEN